MTFHGIKIVEEYVEEEAEEEKKEERSRKRTRRNRRSIIEKKSINLMICVRHYIVLYCIKITYRQESSR